MTLQIHLNPNAYRQNGHTPTQITRQLRADVQQALDPILRTIGQVIWTGDRQIDTDVLETSVQQNADNADGGDWRALYADALARRPMPGVGGPGWLAIYKAVLTGQRLPFRCDPDDVLDAVGEIARDVCSGWLTVEQVQSKLPLLDKLCTVYGCLEMYDQLVALIEDRQRAHASPFPASGRGRG